MGPGLTKGYPIELTCITLATTEFRPGQLALCGVINTKAGALGLLVLRNGI